MKPWLMLLPLLLWLGSCSTPQYQTRYNFIPPASQSGLACVQQCSTAQAQCDAAASQQHNQCLLKARQQAKAEMPGRIAAYEQELDVWEARIRDYERDMAFYEMELRHYQMMRDLHRGGCRGTNTKHVNDCRRLAHRWRGTFWQDEPSYPGPAPRRPVLDKVVAEISSKTCQKNTQCAETNRQCYQQCGGKVEPYQVCTSNCGS